MALSTRALAHMHMYAHTHTQTHRHMYARTRTHAHACRVNTYNVPNINNIKTLVYTGQIKDTWLVYKVVIFKAQSNIPSQVIFYSALMYG